MWSIKKKYHHNHYHHNHHHIIIKHEWCSCTLVLVSVCAWLKSTQHECKISVATMSSNNACKTIEHKKTLYGAKTRFFALLFFRHVLWQICVLDRERPNVYVQSFPQVFAVFTSLGHFILGWVNDFVRFAATFIVSNK